MNINNKKYNVSSKLQGIYYLSRYPREILDFINLSIGSMLEEDSVVEDILNSLFVQDELHNDYYLKLNDSSLYAIEVEIIESLINCIENYNNEVAGPLVAKDIAILKNESTMY